MSADINSARRWVKAAIAFVLLTVANEDTMKTLWIKLVVTISIPGCDYALQRHEYLLENYASSLEFGMLCLCGHTFCWSCKLKSHRPVTCNDASAWFSPILYTLKNTKPCRRRNSHR